MMSDSEKNTYNESKTIPTKPILIATEEGDDRLQQKKTFNEDSKQPILIVDLIRSILERLSFVDFHRARCVSSEWYSASESCINVTNPWIILFPSEHVESNNDSCKLYDPHEHKTYVVRDLGFDLARSRCLTSSGNWFLMLDCRTKFHILNVFTRVRIPLPSLESTDSKIGKAVLWVDEKSKDYLVVWNLDSLFAYHKKRDDNNSWKMFQPFKKNQGCIDMVLKESKLYVRSVTQEVTVLDLSGDESPVKCATLPLFDYYSPHKKLAVTLSGEVLIIVGKMNPYPGRD